MHLHLHLLTASACAVQYSRVCVCPIVVVILDVFVWCSLPYTTTLRSISILRSHRGAHFSPILGVLATFDTFAPLCPVDANHTNTHKHTPHPLQALYTHPTTHPPTFQFFTSFSLFQFFTPFIRHFSPLGGLLFTYRTLTYLSFHYIPLSFYYPLLPLFTHHSSTNNPGGGLYTGLYYAFTHAYTPTGGLYTG
jgi:hypothetical protein